MELVHAIRAALVQGSLVYSLDLKDVYFHIPIHPMSRKFLRFIVKDKVFQFQALAFCLSLAPLYIHPSNDGGQSFSTCQGLTLFQYLDNWPGQSPKEF